MKTVSPQSIPPIILAAVMFYAGIYNLLIFFRRAASREYLSFSLTCVFMGLYDVFCAALYSVGTSEQGGIWQRLQGVSLALVCIAYPWFVLDYLTRFKVFRPATRISLGVFSAVFLIMAACGLLNAGGLFWDTLHPLVKTVSLPFGLRVAYHEVAPGILSNVQSGLGFLVFLYVLGFALRARWAGAKALANPLIAAMGFIFLAMINDTAVSVGIYSFVYIIEYSYLAMVVLMARFLGLKVAEAGAVKAALRMSQGRYRMLVEATTDWIWEVDRNGVYTYSSPKVFDLLGFRPEEVVGRSVFSFMVPSESDRVAERFRACVASGLPIDRMEKTNLRKDGRSVVLETNGVLVRNAAGEVIGFRGIDRDITERKAAEEELREHSRQIEALRQVGLELMSELDIESLLRSVASRAMELIGASSGGIWFHDGNRDALEWRIGIGPISPPSGSILRRGEGLAGRVWDTGGSLIVNGYEAWEGKSLHLIAPDYALMGSPVRWGDEFFGVLCVANDVSRHFGPADAELLELFATQAAIAVRNAHLYEAATSRTERLSVVNRIASAVGAPLGLDEILAIVYRETAGVFGADSFLIGLYDERRAEYDLRLRMSGGVRLQALKVAAAGGVDSPQIRGLLQEGFTGEPLRSWLCAPMLSAERVTGIIGIGSRNPGAYGADDEQLLTTIAEEMTAAVERTKLYQTLRDSEGRYRALFEQAIDAVILLGTDGRILDVNSRACDLLGRERGPFLELHATDIVPSDSPLLSSMESGDAPRPTRIEGEFMRQDGSRVAVEVGMALLDVGGVAVLFVIAHDITDRRRIEEELRQVQKMEAVGTLAGGIAHDFNNILTGILGYASLLRQELPGGGAAAADVEAIAGAAKRGAELTNQLLTFSRRSPHVEMAGLDVNFIAREVARFLERTIDKSIALKTKLDPGLAPVLGNSGQLHQAVLNLCLNACDAMPHGGFLLIETANIRGLAPGKSHGNVVLLRVQDTGVGMEAAVRDRIFEPFYTTKEKGRGLGLAMVYGIVHGHSGDIHVLSEPGKGSTFEIVLPASEEALEPRTKKGRTHSHGGHETILVIDDEEPVRNVLQRILERGGYGVIAAEDGVRGVEIYRERRAEIGLVILDMAMPCMSGGETFESLLAIDPHVRVLISSGYSEEGRATELLERGAVGFLRKPYGIDGVYQSVRDGLERHKAK
jgi:PAS domain S-box-containing protein